MKKESISVLKSIREVYDLAGTQNVKLRQFILSDITGKKIPKAKAGINAFEAALLDISGIDTTGLCYAEQRDKMADWIKTL